MDSAIYFLHRMYYIHLVYPLTLKIAICQVHIGLCRKNPTSGQVTLEYMGTFPEGQQYLSAAGENRDIGPPWRDLYLTDRILLCIDQ